MIAFALAAMLQQEPQVLHRVFDDGVQYVQVLMNRLDPAKLSPKRFGEVHWEFDWLTQGYTKLSPSDQQWVARFRVYSQERKQTGDKGPMVARMALRMWDRLYHRLHIDHQPDINNGLVDYYLCFGGEPGGEQLFGQEFVPARNDFRKVNTIYIYQLSTFKNPVEMAREVAHEYGHAVLPPIGGFKQPEEWANGYLGERLFLDWLSKDLQTRKLTPDDVMGAAAADLAAWVKRNVDGPALAAAAQAPDANQINEASSGMDQFLALACYVERLCPASVFRRSLEMCVRGTSDTHAAQPPTDFPVNVVAAAAEQENMALSIPESLVGKNVWIPLGKGKVSGGTVLARAANGWAQVAALMPTIVVQNPPLR